MKHAVEQKLNQRKRVLESDDSEEETKKKHSKRRSTEQENYALFAAFGNDITAKKMPSGDRIAKLALKIGTRTIPQIRTQVHNYIAGKAGQRKF